MKKFTMAWEHLVIGLLTHISASSGQVKFVEGGYNNVVVDFSKTSSSNLPNPCIPFFTSFEESFREFSRQLYESTNGRAFIRSVDVVLPSEWNTTGCLRSVTRSPVAKEADFLVGKTHPLFRDSPWTQQSQSCSKAGDFVSASASYFASPSVNNTSRGRKLLRQWARYRYGIFDETTCPGEEFCDAVGHDASARTKHNTLCQKISPKEIILRHSDFNTTLTAPVARTSTVFNYRTLSWPRFVVAVDHAVGSIDRDSWNYTRVALRMLLDYMDPEMEFGLLAFTRNSTEIYQDILKLRPPRNMDHLTPLPALAKQVDGESCLYCGLIRALQMLESDGNASAGHSVLFITSGSISAQQMTNLTQLAADKQVRVSVVVYDNQNTAESLSYLKSLTRDTKGFFSTVPVLMTSTNLTARFLNLSVLTDLEDILVSYVKFHGDLKPISLHVKIHQTMFNMGPKPPSGDKEGRNGSFVIDSSVRNAILRIYFSQTENMYSILGFSVSNGTYTLPGKRFFPRDLKPLVYFWPQDDSETCFSRPGNWSYKFSRRYPTVQPNYVRLIAKLNVTSRQKEPSVSLSIIPPDLPARFTPRAQYLILAAVRWNQLPVLNARVKAVIRSPPDHALPSVEIVLLDDGAIGTDITHGDGVYSARLDYDPGHETVSISVDDNQEAAYTILSNYRGSIECCDSVIIVPEEGREPLTLFNITTPAKSLKVDAKQSPSTANTTRALSTDLLNAPTQPTMIKYTNSTTSSLTTTTNAITSSSLPSTNTIAPSVSLLTTRLSETITPGSYNNLQQLNQSTGRYITDISTLQHYPSSSTTSKSITLSLVPSTLMTTEFKPTLTTFSATNSATSVLTKVSTPGSTVDITTPSQMMAASSIKLNSSNITLLSPSLGSDSNATSSTKAIDAYTASLKTLPPVTSSTPQSTSQMSAVIASNTAPSTTLTQISAALTDASTGLLKTLPPITSSTIQQTEQSRSQTSAAVTSYSVSSTTIAPKSVTLMESTFIGPLSNTSTYIPTLTTKAIDISTVPSKIFSPLTPQSSSAIASATAIPTTTTPKPAISMETILPPITSLTTQSTSQSSAAITSTIVPPTTVTEKSTTFTETYDFKSNNTSISTENLITVQARQQPSASIPRISISSITKIETRVVASSTRPAFYLPLPSIELVPITKASIEKPTVAPIDQSTSSSAPEIINSTVSLISSPSSTFISASSKIPLYSADSTHPPQTSTVSNNLLNVTSASLDPSTTSTASSTTAVLTKDQSPVISRQPTQTASSGAFVKNDQSTNASLTVPSRFIYEISPSMSLTSHTSSEKPSITSIDTTPRTIESTFATRPTSTSKKISMDSVRTNNSPSTSPGFYTFVILHFICLFNM